MEQAVRQPSPPQKQGSVRAGIARRGMIIATNESGSQRDLSWLDFGYLRDISSDGKTILFEEEGNESQSYQIFVRDVGGSPAVPIGKDMASPSRPTSAGHSGKSSSILSTNYGFCRRCRLATPHISAQHFPLVAGRFLPDSHRILYVGQERSSPQDLAAGYRHSHTPRPISPEGVVGVSVSSDDKWVLTGNRKVVSAYLAPRALVHRRRSGRKHSGLEGR